MAREKINKYFIFELDEELILFYVDYHVTADPVEGIEPPPKDEEISAYVGHTFDVICQLKIPRNLLSPLFPQNAPSFEGLESAVENYMKLYSEKVKNDESK